MRQRLWPLDRGRYRIAVIEVGVHPAVRCRDHVGDDLLGLLEVPAGSVAERLAVRRTFKVPGKAIQFIVSLVCGAILGYLLHLAAFVLQNVKETAEVYTWFAATFGPPLTMLILSFVATLHIGGVR